MDFENAARRLARDQSKLKGRQRRVVQVSAKASREAEFHKKQQERMAMERKKQKRRLEYMESYVIQCDRDLGVKALRSMQSNVGDGVGSGVASAPPQFTATSIHGEGDKIALPPSALEYMTTAGIEMSPGSPWTFRVGIPNPGYSFPSSPLLKGMKVPGADYDADDDDDDDGTTHSDSEDDGDGGGRTAAYLDEMSHKYLSYTHGSVVEFTQEEGHVGLPAPIAAALLTAARGKGPAADGEASIPVRRTIDRAAAAAAGEHSDAMDVDVEVGGTKDDDDDEEKTPGHIAWGAFDIPDAPVEVSLVRLPKGRACTLVPTPEAISNGFYNLKDVKLVLEQSLIRTRATLSVGDLLHTWHRGIRYDLTVASVKPSKYNAVLCINTDIEVDFHAPTTTSSAAESAADAPVGTAAGASAKAEGADPRYAQLKGGRTLSESTAPAADVPASRPPTIPDSSPLSPEPPSTQTDGVCVVQVRGDGSQGRRRFDVRLATVGDLFRFAASVVRDGNAVDPDDAAPFRLVTRFPRRVLDIDRQGNMTLSDAGVRPGQELFMIERT